MHYLFWITCFGFAASTVTALLSSDEVMFTTVGDCVTLPCAVGSGSHCSSVNWTKNDSPIPLVTAGQVRAPNVNLLRDCSLKICNVHNDNATTYVCVNGKRNSSSSVVLRILHITENINTVQGKIELHCFLNDHSGIVKRCNKSGILLSWLAEDTTVLKNNSKRFLINNVTNCFWKLHIQQKPTDHLRKWRCQVSLNGSAKANVSYTTTVSGGIEEVFAAVGESLPLTCPITSSGLTGKCQTAPSVTHTDSTTIVKVTPQHAGEYQCIDKGKLKNMTLHTFDITSELDPQGQNVTLTCALTCACVCDEDFNLTWSNGDATYSSLLNVNGSLINKLSIPLVQLNPDETVCSVLREGVQVATKKWHHSETLSPGLAWIAAPIVILCIAVIGIFCVYRKRKRNKDPEHVQTHIGMTHVYEYVKDYKPRCKSEGVTSNDSFYDLLQAVN